MCTIGHNDYGLIFKYIANTEISIIDLLFLYCFILFGLFLLK